MPPKKKGINKKIYDKNQKQRKSGLVLNLMPVENSGDGVGQYMMGGTAKQGAATGSASKSNSIEVEVEMPGYSHDEDSGIRIYQSGNADQEELRMTNLSSSLSTNKFVSGIGGESKGDSSRSSTDGHINTSPPSSTQQQLQLGNLIKMERPLSTVGLI